MNTPGSWLLHEAGGPYSTNLAIVLGQLRVPPTHQLRERLYTVLT